MILRSASGRSPKGSIPEILLKILLLAVFRNRGSTVHVCGKSCDMVGGGGMGSLEETLSGIVI